jgi:hypothetical protein
MWRTEGAEQVFSIMPFSITSKRILCVPSIRHISAKMAVPSISPLLMLVFPVAHILTH